MLISSFRSFGPFFSSRGKLWFFLLVLYFHNVGNVKAYVKCTEEIVRKLHLCSALKLTGFSGGIGTTAHCFSLHHFQSPKDHLYWEIKLTLPSREARDYLYSSPQKLPGPVRKQHVCSILGISHGASTYRIFALCLLVWAPFPLVTFVFLCSFI